MNPHAARLKPVEAQIAAIEKPYRDRLRERKRERLDPAYAAALAAAEEERTPSSSDWRADAQRMLNVSWRRTGRRTVARGP